MIRNKIFDSLTSDNCTAEYYSQTKKNILYGLSELIGINWRVKDILKKVYLEEDIDFASTHKKFAKTSCTHYFIMDKTLKEELYFNSLQSYFSFLIMKFLSSKPKVVLCGNFLFPKPKRKHPTVTE